MELVEEVSAVHIGPDGSATATPPTPPAPTAPAPRPVDLRAPDANLCEAAASSCGAFDDVSWLLNRAAQRLADAVHAEAQRHGVGMRAQLVLSALTEQGGRTQLALGADLSVDKTTLTTELDRLESCGLVHRRPDARDRRVRIPEITDRGRQIQSEVSLALKKVVDDELSELSSAERTALEDSLRRIVARPV
jgi:DNA-binding MarR family transcriptional regulator